MEVMCAVAAFEDRATNIFERHQKAGWTMAFWNDLIISVILVDERGISIQPVDLCAVICSYFQNSSMNVI